MRVFPWLLPPADVHRRFAALIDMLSRRLGTPRFHPHITLAEAPDLPERDMVSRAAALATRLAPVPVRLTQVDGRDEYFRCLYVLAEPDAALLAAHRAARAQFDVPAPHAFMPHLSLVYGALSSAEKERIAREIGPRLDTAFHADRIGLCLAPGPVPQWRLIHAFPLTGPSGTDDPH